MLSFVLFTCPLSAQLVQQSQPSPALERDSIAYAEKFDTDIEEALRRLQMQESIGRLDETLTESTAEVFGGLWIEHQPSFRIVTLFTQPSVAEEILSEHALGELASLVEVRSAAVTLKQLEEQLLLAQAQLESSGQAADLWINVRENQVEYMTPDPAGLTAAFASKRLQMPENTRVVQVQSLFQLQADMRGGRPLTNCTSGFTVRSDTGQLGISTAAHCSNSTVYEDVFISLTFQSERFRDHYDVQWHTARCSDTMLNQIFDGTANRTINAAVGRNAQAIGAFVCKHGEATGATCGTIDGKSVRPIAIPSADATFICVRNDNVTISSGGDSGAPWFAGNSAYGIHSGGNGSNQAVYMAVDYMEDRGYRVLDYAANANPWAEVTCTRTARNFHCSVSGRGGSPPYTFSGWQYYGPAASWSTGFSSISGNYGSFPGCVDGEFNSVLVQVTDSCGRTGYGSATFDCLAGDEGCGITRICDGPTIF